jgi:hypothetical protein
MWFPPFALLNADAAGLVPILLPIVAVRHGTGHVGLVLGPLAWGPLPRPWWATWPTATAIAAGLWGYPAALGIGAGAVLVGLCVFAVRVLPGRGRP